MIEITKKQLKWKFTVGICPPAPKTFGVNLGPPDYESDALTSDSYRKSYRPCIRNASAKIILILILQNRIQEYEGLF